MNIVYHKPVAMLTWIVVDKVKDHTGIQGDLVTLVVLDDNVVLSVYHFSQALTL